MVRNGFRPSRVVSQIQEDPFEACQGACCLRLLAITEDISSGTGLSCKTSPVTERTMIMARPEVDRSRTTARRGAFSLSLPEISREEKETGLPLMLNHLLDAARRMFAGIRRTSSGMDVAG